jgi:inositol transport system substrate-binding protein
MEACATAHYWARVAEQYGHRVKLLHAHYVRPYVRRNKTDSHGVIANNDESAIGAIQAMKAAGIDMGDVVVGGVDATQDALQAMQAGELDATVFQDAAGQGSGALDAALKLAKGEAVDQKVYIPFQLVTPANIDQFLAKN